MVAAVASRGGGGGGVGGWGCYLGGVEQAVIYVELVSFEGWGDGVGHCGGGLIGIVVLLLSMGCS